MSCSTRNHSSHRDAEEVNANPEIQALVARLTELKGGIRGRVLDVCCREAKVRRSRAPSPRLRRRQRRRRRRRRG